MYVPRLNPPLRVPRYLRSLAILSVGIAVALLLWGVLSLSTAGNDGHHSTPFLPAPETVRTMAFISGAGASDELVLVSFDGTGRTVLHSFESRGDAPSRGLASPRADRVAVLHPAQHNGYRLTFVSTATGSLVTSPALLDASSHLVWSSDGSTLLATTAAPADGTGRTSVSVLAVNPFTGATTTVATFEGVFQAQPLAFDASTGRVTMAVVNPSGSSLWAVEGDAVTQLSTLSAGRTKNWQLSPDAQVVAFIETQNGAPIPSIGRVAAVSTGQLLTTATPAAAQEGVSWRPGSESPVFGGPGSSLNLPGSANGAYLVPSSWAPLGDAVVVRVVTPGEGETSTASWELLSQGGGEQLAAGADKPHGELSNTATALVEERQLIFPRANKVSFLGWVQTTGAGEAD